MKIRKTALHRRAEAERAPLREVLDAETGELVHLTNDQIRRAAWMHRQVEMATLVKAVALARIADEKLYLGLGCSSMREYAETMLPLGYRAVQTYIQIGRKFAPLVPQLTGADVKALPGAPAPADVEQIVEGVGGLGFAKLRDLVSVDDAVFEEIVEEQQLTLPDGRVITLEELKAMAAKEFREKLEEAQMDKRAYQARIAQLEEEKKLLQSERENLERHLREAEERAQRKGLEASRIAEQYGPKITETEVALRYLSEVLDLWDQIRFRLTRLEISEDSPQMVIDKLHTAITTMCAQMAYDFQHWRPVIERALDRPVFTDPLNPVYLEEPTLSPAMAKVAAERYLYLHRAEALGEAGDIFPPGTPLDPDEVARLGIVMQPPREDWLLHEPTAYPPETLEGLHRRGWRGLAGEDDLGVLWQLTHADYGATGIYADPSDAVTEALRVEMARRLTPQDDSHIEA